MRSSWEARAESNPFYAIDAGRRDWTLDDSMPAVHGWSRALSTLPCASSAWIHQDACARAGCGMGQLLPGWRSASVTYGVSIFPQA